MRHSQRLLAIVFFLLVAPNADAGTVIVNQLDSGVPGTWGTFVTGGGSASLVDLTGLGGNLENSQPLAIGAGFLTTGANNSDRGEIGINKDFGLASDLLNTLEVGYSYYKVNVGNLSAAPSLKLAIYNPDGVGDSFGQLIYEASWNQPSGGSHAPPTDAWQTVSIDADTGAGDNASGGWWWTGGFGQPNGAGGTPIQSAREWGASFATSSDFTGARIVGISVGVGTFNQSQQGYFDRVVFGAVSQEPTIWDFEPSSSVVPEPTSALTFGMIGLIAGLGGYRRRKKA